MTAKSPSTPPALGEGELRQILQHANAKLKDAGIESARMEARLLLAHAFGAQQEDIIAGRLSPNAVALARFEDGLARRVAQEPLAYILGRREFWSLPFFVGPGVLIPRPESELLIEEALRSFPDRDQPLRVLDLGTGSGCLLLAFLSERPRATGLGVDLSDKAITYATHNAKALNLASRAEFLHGNWSAVAGYFDVVLANPPYVKSQDLEGLALDIREYEPHVALDGGLDGLNCYRSIAMRLPGLLDAKARAFVELGQHQAERVGEIFASQGLAVEGIVNDFAYIPRCLVASAAAQQSHVKRKIDMEKETRSG